jgi:hypothetical protein
LVPFSVTLTGVATTRTNEAGGGDIRFSCRTAIPQVRKVEIWEHLDIGNPAPNRDEFELMQTKKNRTKNSKELLGRLSHGASNDFRCAYYAGYQSAQRTQSTHIHPAKVLKHILTLAFTDKLEQFLNESRHGRYEPSSTDTHKRLTWMSLTGEF